MRPVGSQGEEAGSAPLGRLGGSSHLCAGGTEGGSITSTSKAGPSWQAGRRRFGDAWELTRSRGFAAADPGARLHLPASVVEVHVAARRLRRIVPLGICSNGTIRLRGERLFSGSTRSFELSSGVFLLCAKRLPRFAGAIRCPQCHWQYRKLQIKPMIQHIGAFSVFSS